MKMTTIVPKQSNVIVAAIGDVHGMEALLDYAVLRVCDYAVANHMKPIFVFLGDLVDRGPRSCEAVSAVVSLVNEFPGSTLVMGNHDYWLWKFLLGDLSQRDFDNWMGNGGTSALVSYFGQRRFDHADMVSMSEDANGRFPAHLPLLSTASDIVCFGRFAFVHAGIRPKIPLKLQDPSDLRWIRDDFLKSADEHSHVIVHGHTVTPNLIPEVRPNRIALDTGAASSGRLSVGLFTTSKMLRLAQHRALGDGAFDDISFL